MKPPMKMYSDSGMMGMSLLAIVLLYVCQKEKGGYLSAATVFLVLSIPSYSLGEAFFGVDKENMRTTKMDVLLKSIL